MADENVIGLAMRLDVADLKSGIKEVNNIIKSSKDEFNNATAGMDMWAKSSEGLNAKLSQLGKQLNAQEKAVAGYEAEIERVKNLEGDHTQQLNNLNLSLQKAQAEVKKTQSQISHYNDSLKEVSRAEKEEASTLGKLTKKISDQKKELGNLTKDYKNAVITYGKNSKEAKSLASQINNLSKEIESSEKKVQNADKAFDGLGKSFEEVGGQISGKLISGFAKVGAAVGGVVTAFLATAEGTREFRTNMGKVDTAFEQNGFTAKQAEQTYKDFYGVLGDEGKATEAISHLSSLANTQEDLSKWTDICTGIYAKFGDSLPIEGLTEASNETAKTGKLTGVLTDALNWAGQSEDEFQSKLDSCNNESERQALITETLTGLYSDASKQYKETNKDIIASNEAQAELSKAMADIGAKAEPLMTQIKLIGTKILEAFLPVLEKIIPFIEDHLPLVIGVVGGLTGAIGLLSAAIGILKLKTELATIATTAKTVAEKVAAGSTKALTAAQWLLNAAMSANPIGIVIVAITALVAAFVLLWKKSEAFRNFWKGLWEGIKKATKVVVDAISKFFSGLWDGIKKVWSGVSDWFGKKWDGIKKGASKMWSNIKETQKQAFDKTKETWGKVGDWFGKQWDKVKKGASVMWNNYKDNQKNAWNTTKNVFGKVGSWFSDKFKSAWEGIKNAFSNVKSFFTDVMNKVTSPFKNLPSKIKEFFSKAWDTVKYAWSNPKQFFTEVITKIIDTFKNLPSRLKEVGKNLVEGLWNGVTNMASWLSGKLKGFSDNVLGGIKKFFGVHSPSTKMAEIGGYMAEGLANGLEDGTDDVINAGNDIGNEFANSFNESASNGVAEGSNKVTESFDSLTNKIEHQKNRLSNLQSQYKSAILTFGETSHEAYAVGRQIISLSKELAENELKVKNLDDSYKNLNGTLANQMRIELNNAKNSKKALEEQKANVNKLFNEAGRKGDYEAAKEYSQQIVEINNKINKTSSTIKELTDNLDYMAQQEKKAAQAQSGATEKAKNAYEKLVQTIEEQKKKLEGLKTEYESAVLKFGEGSTKAKDLADKIRKVTDEIAANEAEVKRLDVAYAKLNGNPVNKVFDDRTVWQKFIDNFENALEITDEKLKEWSEGAGVYFSKLSNHFEKITGEITNLFNSIGNYFDQKISQRIEEIDTAIEKLQKTNEKEIETAETAANAEMEIVSKQFEENQISAQEYRDQKKKIEDEIAKYTKKKNDEAAAQEKKLLAEKDRLARKQFEAQQNNSITQALINGASAIIKNFAEYGFIAGGIMNIGQAAATAAEIATIKAQKYVPMLAKGGIADSATLAMIGENGKEAVLPLEKNTGWIDTLAEKLSSIMQKDMLNGVQSGIPAYAMAGGNTVINNNYYQTINSPKALSRREIYRDSKNLLALKG